MILCEEDEEEEEKDVEVDGQFLHPDDSHTMKARRMQKSV